MGNSEESSLLWEKDLQSDDKRKLYETTASSSPLATAKLVHPPLSSHLGPGTITWTAEGHSLGHVRTSCDPNHRNQWDSTLFNCLGRSDEFCSSDFEVCLLGTVAPCVLYASNVERLGSSPTSFASHCLPYSGLYLIGNSFLGGNFLAPWFSYSYRSSIRRKFNLEGGCESAVRSCGVCGDFVAEEDIIEQCERVCDFGTHVFCHACALCQEGREIRRRIPHPGFTSQPVLFMIPPGEQIMARLS
ncbi:cell number regulator 8-like [Impatiens glandulifera]|uniref:cell number regulator 8-like n=1 Tax=Impatiens glandulifera TaxID=253017 RepID=UPI001FB17E88|nr:cell number regulator 8-like [Impatiens glandulifera]